MWLLQNYGTQIEEFLSRDPMIGEDDVFVIWGGHNDMFLGRTPEAVSLNLKSHMETLTWTLAQRTWSCSICLAESVRATW